MARPILFLDVSRLVRRFENFGGPTGIDRVEINYARWLMRQTTFEGIAVTRSGKGLVALPAKALLHLEAALTARWSAGNVPGFGKERRSALAYLAERATFRARRLAMTRGASAPDPGGHPAAYLNVGHDGLDEPERYIGLAAVKAAFVHDVIPLTHPEYDTPRATALHRARVDAVASHMDLIFGISRAAMDDFATVAPRTTAPRVVAPLGPAIDAPTNVPAAAPAFVHLSSVNRRKNLAFLLHVWREMAQDGTAPTLVVIGRRGNDATALELLDRCEALRSCVTHLDEANDEAAAQQLKGATALLTPSFAEGFGLPIVEAHAFGVPVIASDIPVHREVGGSEALYCGTTDGPGWRNAIETLFRDEDARNALASSIVPPPTWDHHFKVVTSALIEAIDNRR
ncbi:MAG: glycosyltransferase [Pseudomonadota bacterium]